MNLLLVTRISCVGINPLQKKNPPSVGQWIGRRLEIHVLEAELPCKNRESPIKTQDLRAQFSISSRRLPENGQPNRATWYKSRLFLHCPESSSCHLAECAPRPTYRAIPNGDPNGADTVVNVVIVRNQGGVAERPPLAQHRTIQTLGPVIQATSRACIKRDRCGLVPTLALCAGYGYL